MPLVEFRLAARRHVVPERQDALARDRHGADGNGPEGLASRARALTQCATLGGMREPVMPEPVETARAAAPARGAVVRALFGSVRLAYLPVLVTYFCYGASGITSIALLYFQKETLGITPAEAAAIAFWVALPWSTKMVAGVASDVHPIFGRRRVSYLLLGALLAFAGYGWLATTASTKATYLAAMVIIAVGFMVQDVVADALSVELARTTRRSSRSRPSAAWRCSGARSAWAT